MTPQERLRHHVSGAVERGEAEPVVEVTWKTLFAEQARLEWEGGSCAECGLPAPCPSGHFPVADRAETDPCQAGTVGCCVDHPLLLDHPCETW